MKQIDCLRSCQRIWPIWRAWLWRQSCARPSSLARVGSRLILNGAWRGCVRIRPKRGAPSRFLWIAKPSPFCKIRSANTGTGSSPSQRSAHGGENTRAWYSAFKRAGEAPLRFHDPRHTFASGHVQQGTPLSVLQELGGWQVSAMVPRCAHLGAEHLAPWNDRLASYGSTKRGTNLAQSTELRPSTARKK